MDVHGLRRSACTVHLSRQLAGPVSRRHVPEVPMTPVMFCLRCGYRQQMRGGGRYTDRDRKHMRRCNYTMTIRYVTETGRIAGGDRRLREQSPDAAPMTTLSIARALRVQGDA